jgi:hypothetical protein
MRTARFAMVAAGFSIEDRSETGFTASKGSPASTLAFGRFAGRQLWTIQYVDGLLMTDGTAVVQVSRNLLDDALNEKYLGPSKLQTEFDATSSRLTDALGDAHLLG